MEVLSRTAEVSLLRFTLKVKTVQAKRIFPNNYIIIFPITKLKICILRSNQAIPKYLENL